MSEHREVSADELGGGVTAAEAPDEYQPPTDVLVAMRPFGRKTITAAGVPKPFDVIEAYCVEVLDDGEYVDHGLRDVGWQFVMRELDKATDEAPWIVGTIVKKGRAFFLTPPDAADLKAAKASVDALVYDRSQEK